MEFPDIEEAVRREKLGEVDMAELTAQTPSIKIIKNTKGYNFEFKVLSLDTQVVDDVHFQIVALIKKWETQVN